MAGLSMGSMETHSITLRRPEVFGSYGLMSGAMYNPQEIQNAGGKTKPNYIFISTGEKERPDGVRKAVEDLKAAGIENYIHVKCNVLDTLKEYNAKLGI